MKRNAEVSKRQAAGQSRTFRSVLMRNLPCAPNTSAVRSGRNRTGLVGLVVPDTGPVFARLADEIERVVAAEGSELVMTCAKSLGGDPARAVRFLKQRRCDAFIVYSDTMSNTQVLRMMSREPNLVLINRWVGRYRQRCVAIDGRAGARLATRYLIDCGHRDIAVITGAANSHESEERFAGFVETMNEAGLVVDPRLVAEGEFSVNSGERGVVRLLSGGRYFSALFCFSDETARGAMSYMRNAGFSLPGDLSVIGFDDIPYCSQIHPPLTTIHQPIGDIGRIAAQRALALSIGREAPGGALLSPRLVVRGSVVQFRTGSASEATTPVGGTRWTVLGARTHNRKSV